MKLTRASGDSHIAPIDRALPTVAVLLMLGGAALLVASVGRAGIWIPVTAIGIALAVLVQRRRRP